MSPRPVAPPEQQPDSFEFRPEVWAEAEKIIARYPEAAAYVPAPIL